MDVHDQLALSKSQHAKERYLKITTLQTGAITSILLDFEPDELLEKWLYFTSDTHFDSVYCDRSMFFEDMDNAILRDASICIIGDFFDAMQGRFDPRRDMSALRPEYRRSDYYDYVVKDSVNMLEKYSNNIMMISPGNHELSILKNANTFLSDRLVSSLNSRTGSKIIHGGYGGWLRIVLRVGNQPKGSINIKYFHGAGGEAPVTRGAIQTNRQAVYLPDADIVINGHSHNAYWIPITRERIGNKGDHYFDTQHHLRTPGYMQSYGDGTTGWEVTRGGVPKPLGSCFVKIGVSNRTKKYRPTINIEPLIHNPIAISPVVDLFHGVVFPQE